MPQTITQKRQKALEQEIDYLRLCTHYPQRFNTKAHLDQANNLRRKLGLPAWNSFTQFREWLEKEDNPT